jgi:class 3 adenylate cyclase
MNSSFDPFRLHFKDPEVEAEWAGHRDDEARSTVRLGMIAFAIIIALGALGDYWQQFAAWREVVLVRFLVWAPIALLGAALVSRPQLRGRVLDVTAAVAVSITLSVLALMTLVMPRSTAVDYPMYWTVLLLVVHVVTPLGFRRSLTAGFVVIMSYVTTMLHYEVSGKALSSHTTFILFAWALLVASSWLLERQQRMTFVAERDLFKAKERVEGILRAIFPAQIVERLQAGEQSIADEVPEATVLFADIVGFTSMSRRMSAPAVVAFLDRLFSKFEDLTAKHGVDKVKTIGDGYMAVTGTTGQSEGGAVRMVNLALDLMDAVRDHVRESGADIRLRIGIHRGPVVAGVLGRSRFSYDLWGDTVNVASRLEASGEPGHIQVSRALTDAIGEEFKVTPRGVVEIKGVGPIDTWWVERRT